MSTKALFATRAEELGNRVFDYFAMPSDSFYRRLLNNKAAVIVGGRGTGKTMLLKSLAYEYRVANKDSLTALDFWQQDRYLGCYVRADTNIVSSFKGRGIGDETWRELFAHYFNLRVVQQIIKTLKAAVEKNIINDEKLAPFYERYCELTNATFFTNIADTEKHVRKSLDELVRYLNNPRRVEAPILLNNGTLIFECCNTLSEIEPLSEKVWFILIDEFENLNPDQQRIVNTLIKANQPPVIFKIAMRPGGWWTQETLTNSETLENIADFDMINYQTDFDDSDYENLILKAFEKSLINNNIINKEYQNVKVLLPELSPEDEAKKIFNSTNMKHNFIKKIELAIDECTTDSNVRIKLREQLILPEEPLKTRFNLVLLERGKKPFDIVNQIENSPKKYLESYRHSKMGTLFMFCREYKRKKIYSGFNTYLLLSSKIIRNFVSLFSRAWEISIDGGFTVNDPKPFDFEDQSEAAYDVSQGKVFEISAYPVGHNLSGFANYLGRIFEQLNKDPKQSQPERNHLGLVGDVSNEANSVLRGALMYSVLQETPATKLRAQSEVRGVDYLFNRIYCPYYNLSYRKIHKLEIKSNDFEKLVLGSDEDRKDVTMKLIKRYIKDVSESDAEIVQLDLFNQGLPN
jgi:hypothetical protein